MSFQIIIKVKLHQYATLLHSWLGIRLQPRPVREQIRRIRDAAKKYQRLLLEKGLRNVTAQAPHPASDPCYQFKLIPFKSVSGSITAHLSFGEQCVISDFLHDNAVAFDIGAFHGEWTQSVLKEHKNVRVFLFEASPQAFEILQSTLSSANKNSIQINNLMVGAEERENSFFQYDKDQTLNTAFRRVSVESSNLIGAPKEIKVTCITIDSFCKSNSISHIHFIKIDAEGAEHAILVGASQMLNKGYIDFLQFKYGGTYIDSGITLAKQFNLLNSFDYDVYKITDQGLLYIPEYFTFLEDFEQCDYLVAHSRLRSILLGYPPSIPFFLDQFDSTQIARKGVMHVGAHLGEEVSNYKMAGFQNIVLVEANPELVTELQAKFAKDKDVQILHFAACDRSGIIQLNITNKDHQSSSVLPLKKHSEIYPEILVERTVEVPAMSIDESFNKFDLDMNNGSQRL